MSLAKLSTSQLAEITGQDRKTVAKYLLEAGLEPQIGHKGAKDYPAAAALRILLAVTSTGTSENVAEEQAKAKLRTTVAQADKAELELAIRRAEYLPADEIIQQVETEYSFIRQRLVGIPSSLARQLALEESADTIDEILSKAINDALTDLTTDRLEVGTNGETSSSGDSAVPDEATPGTPTGT